MPEHNPAPHYNVHLANTKPPFFYGKETEDCNVHWLKFIDYVEEVQLPEDRIVSKFRITLHGDARQWYEVHKADFTDANVLEQRFKEAYRTEISRSELLKQFHRIKLGPSETLVSFKNRLKHLALKAEIRDEEMIRSQFIEGLPDNLKIHVTGRRDTSLEDVLKTAQAVMAVTTPAATAQTIYVAQSDSCKPSNTYEAYAGHTEADMLASQMSHFHVSRPSGRSPAHSPSRSRQRYDQRNSEKSSYHRRSPSRSVSRDRDYERNSRGWDSSQNRGNNRSDRYPTPGRYGSKSPHRDNKRVAFDNQQSLECWYCQGGHMYAECPHLRKALQNGKYSHSHFQ
jgi:hypothetical protein